MPDFEQGDIVRVPFPYTDRSTRQRRPALVISAGGLGEDRRLIWVAMITSARIPTPASKVAPVIDRIRSIQAR